MDSSALTRTGMVMGSPGFMSPEQARGGEAGPPSDIFSLGAVLAFAATGKEPFGSGSGETLLDRVVSSGLPGGAQLISALTAAMQQSVTADRYYQNWMAGYACGSDPGQDTNYLAGQHASAQATAAKKAFLAIWNPMAPSYGQKTYSYTGF